MKLRRLVGSGWFMSFSRLRRRHRLYAKYMAADNASAPSPHDLSFTRRPFYLSVATFRVPDGQSTGVQGWSLA